MPSDTYKDFHLNTMKSKLHPNPSTMKIIQEYMLKSDHETNALFTQKIEFDTSGVCDADTEDPLFESQRRSAHSVSL